MKSNSDTTDLTTNSQISVLSELNKERKKEAFQLWMYSIQRIDLLIIAISGAGIYVCLETLKFHQQHNLEHISAVKWAGAFFIISIVLNLISQFTGREANRYDYLMCIEEIKQDEKTDDCRKSQIASYDTLSSIYDKCTTILNTSSLVAMIIGLIVLLLFFIICL